jgi:hypothetical protein
LNTLLAAFTTLPDGASELITGEGPGDPYQSFFEAVPAQGEIYQLFLNPLEKEEIHQSKAW